MNSAVRLTGSDWLRGSAPSSSIYSSVPGKLFTRYCGAGTVFPAGRSHPWLSRKAGFRPRRGTGRSVSAPRARHSGWAVLFGGVGLFGPAVVLFGPAVGLFGPREVLFGRE